MSFMGTRREAGRTEYGVQSDVYQVERWVGADQVRPHWRRWGTKWRKLDQMQKPAPAKATAPSASPPKPAAAKAGVAPAAPKAGAGPAHAASPPKTAAGAVGAKAAAGPSGVPAAPWPPALAATPVSAQAATRDTAEASPAAARPPIVPPPIPLPLVTGATLERCMALLEALEADDDAHWFARPVSRPWPRPLPATPLRLCSAPVGRCAPDAVRAHTPHPRARARR